MKLKSDTIEALKSLYTLHAEMCKACPSTEPFRCCDDQICAMILNDLETLDLVGEGKKYPGPYEKSDDNIPRFMGEHGCIIAPEDRPMCTEYICPFVMTSQLERIPHYNLQSVITKDVAIEKKISSVTIRGKVYVTNHISVKK